MSEKKIVILGAGLSTAVLIKYLLEQSEKHNWKILVADNNIEHAQNKTKGHPRSEVVSFDGDDALQLERIISQGDVIISMLPHQYHLDVVQSCLKTGKNLVTASYVTEPMRELDQDFKNKGLIFLGEVGLDPGIDHMSAMEVIHDIRAQGFKICSFETFTGGLLAPSYEDNPWKYKFTWNPRNVVLAGQGTVKFLQEGRLKYIPYHRLFRRTEIVHIPDFGYFEGYANRDSLRYLEIYGLEDIQTLYRGTFRRPGYCKAWNCFVQLGATDDSYEMDDVSNLTHRQFINFFLSFNPSDSVELKLAHYLNLDIDSEEMYKLRWLEIFEDEMIGLDRGTPAQILEHILKKKWTMDPDERDMIIMWHKFEYLTGSETKQIHSHMVVLGDDQETTAMSKPVGLPVGISAKLILEGKIQSTGVQIPIQREIYEPVLKELIESGIRFDQKEFCEA